MLTPDKTATVLPEDVRKIIKSCPNGKSPGVDCISYEHLKQGCQRNAYIPEKLKR